MKIKLDENIPRGISSELRSLGHEVHTVLDEELGGESDDRIWAAAQREGRFLITQDLDFSDARNGRHAGILLVRLQAPGRGALILRVRQLFETEAVHEWVGCFVVVTEQKLRVIRPSETEPV